MSSRLVPGHPETGKASIPLLELDDVAMSFVSPGDGTIDVFREIDLVVQAGEMIVVTGRSGSGKTTLIRIASGLLRPVEGVVSWSGQSIDGLNGSRLAERRAAHIGIVFQGAALIDTLTAAENVALPAIPRGVKGYGRERARSLLDQVGVGARSAHFPRQLSGGEQQRVALARAIFADPPLLLVDEPTANLDRRSADQLITLLSELAREGRGLLVASHDPDLVGVGDRVVELEPLVPRRM
jgi:ABC-type lipoprotein export system ATPase subunit